MRLGAKKGGRKKNLSARDGDVVDEQKICSRRQIEALKGES